MDKVRKLLLPVLAAIFLVGNFSPFLTTASAWDIPKWDVPKWDVPAWDAPAWDLDKEQDRQQNVPDKWKDEHEQELSGDGEKQDYVDMSLWELLTSPGELKEYVKRLKNGLAQLPADVIEYFESGDAGEEIKQWWKETSEYLSSGALLNDIKDAALALPKELVSAMFKGETYKGLFNDMTIGMLADIEAFATGIDPRTGKKINLPNRIDNLVQSFAKPAKIVKKVKAFDRIIDKLSIKAIDDKGSKGNKGSKNDKNNKDSHHSGNNTGGKDQNGGGNNGDDDKGKDSGKDSSDGKKAGDKGTGKLIKFKGDEAVKHYEKHSKEIMDAMGKNQYNLKTYLEDANHVIQRGQYVPEMNGYVKLIGGKGSAKYGFVGLDRNTGNITTFHVKSVKELAKKAPSLGIETKK